MWWSSFQQIASPQPGIAPLVAYGGRAIGADKSTFQQHDLSNLIIGPNQLKHRHFPHQKAKKSRYQQHEMSYNPHVVSFNPEASRAPSTNSGTKPWEQRAYTKSRITRIRLEWWAILGSNQ